MKRAVLFILLALALAAQQFPQRRFPSPPEIVLPPNDILKIDPKHYRLEFENERARALRVTLGPDESVPMHDAAAATLVCVSSDCHLRFTPPSGRVEDVHMVAGQTRWIWDESRSEKNLSTHPVEILLIEIKQSR